MKKFLCLSLVFGVAFMLANTGSHAQEVKPPEIKKQEVKAPEVKQPEAKVPEKAPAPESKQAEATKAPEEKAADPLKTLEKDLADAKAAFETSKSDAKVAMDTGWVMIAGFLVFFMNLGFGCVESGFCRAKNTVNILSKNFIVFAVSTIGFWLVGWGIMFGNGDDSKALGKWIGTEGLVAVKGADNSPVTASFESALKDDVKSELGIDLSDEKVAEANKPVVEAVEKYVGLFNKTTSNTVEKKGPDGKVIMKDGKAETEDVMIPVKIAAGGKTLEKEYKVADYYWGDYSAIAWTGVPLMAKFFFQLVFAATAATIVSGAVAERIKYHSFIIFSFAMAIFIYPVVGHWIWGGGFLAKDGFLDFAGSTQVHSIGGWAALIAVIILGPRIGKYGPDGKVNAIPGHSMMAAFIGCFVLWFGWFGFNPGSTMALDGKAIAHVAVTTNLAASAATITATIAAWTIIGKPDIGMTLNGCLAGLVAITAPCAFVTPISALIIGAIAGVLVVLAVIGFDKIRIDDPVGATSVHLVNGVFGTIAVGLFAEESLVPAGTTKFGLFTGGNSELLIAQLKGVGVTAVYVMVASAITWLVIKAVVGMRVTAEEEMEGLDIGEHGNEAYHGFQMISPEIMTGGAEPKAALLPKDGKKRFSVVVEGMPADKIAAIWGDLCQPTKKPSADFLAVYPKMTMLAGNRFKFIDGNPEQVSAHLAKVLQSAANGGAVKTFVEK